jgi:hypothetical protein
VRRYDQLEGEETRQIAAAAAASARRCSNCRKSKPRREFYSGQSWCKTCVRIGLAEYRATPRYLEMVHAYRARPEVREKLRDRDRERHRTEQRRDQLRAYRQTPRARVLHCRCQARARLRAATDPAKIARLTALIAAYDAELARMDLATKELRP